MLMYEKRAARIDGPTSERDRASAEWIIVPLRTHPCLPDFPPKPSIPPDRVRREAPDRIHLRAKVMQELEGRFACCQLSAI